MRSLFVILWALGRVDATARSFICRGTGPERLMARALGPSVDWWSRMLDGVVALLDDVPSPVAWRLQDDGETKQVKALAARWEGLWKWV